MMGVYLKHIQTDRQTGRLSYRRAFPPALQPYLPRRLTELKRSLGAKSQHDPKGVSKYATAQLEYEKLVAKAQAKMAGKARPLTEADIASIVEAHAHWIETKLLETHFDLDDKRRDWIAASAWRYMPYGFWDEQTAIAQGTPRPATAAARIRALLPELIEGWVQAIADGDLAQIIQIEGQTAQDLLDAQHLEISDTDSLFAKLCVSLLQRDLLVAKGLQAQVTDGVLIQPTPRPQISPDNAPAKPSHDTQAETMLQLADRLFASRTDPITGPTRVAWSTSLKLWQQTQQDLAHDKITRAMVTEWLELLVQRPTRVPQALKAIPLPALVERYADKETPRLSGATVSRHLTSLSAIVPRQHQWHRFDVVI